MFCSVPLLDFYEKGKIVMMNRKSERIVGDGNKLLTMRWDDEGKLKTITFSPAIWDLPELEMYGELSLLIRLILTEK